MSETLHVQTDRTEPTDGFQLPAIQREHDALSVSTRARFWHKNYAPTNWRFDAAAAVVAKCQRRKVA
jgi:hypothetical protein